VIARLTGRPAAHDEQTLVLDVGGVGYLVSATRSALRHARKVEEVTLETYLHVREDTMQLYGFAEAEERELFEHLLSVSGVGPKVALAIVSGSTPAELRQAIAAGDTARFQAIPGIGKKTAQRVVLELKEKLDADGVDVPVSTGKEEVLAREALVELGFSLLEADKALAETDPALPPEERVRRVLQAA
jgi:holliday junction DNA helicase RuvA